MIDETSLIWKGFDKVHVDFPDTKEQQVLAGIERFNEARFKREYTVFKMNHFASRVITLNDKFELPYNSILHVADNFGHLGNFLDTPHENNPFIENESLRKFILHVRELCTSGSAVYPDKFILRFAGLPTNLMKFRSENGSKYRYLNTLEEIPTKREALTIVNHNPLFRMRMYGRLPYYRTCTQILASILNTCEKLKHLNKHQFILLPWDDEVFDKQMFIRSRDQLTFMTVRRPNSFHYILMMHLANYMWESATTSMFSKFDKELLSQITLILQLNDKCVFLNLGDIKALNSGNRAYNRFINQLNLLSILGRGETEENFDIEKYIEKDEETHQTAPVVSSSIKSSVISGFAPTKFTQDSEDKEEVEEKVIQHLDTAVPKKEIKKSVDVSNVDTTVPDKTAVITSVTPSGKKETKVAVVTKAANVTQVTERADKDRHNIEYVNDLDKAAIEYIDENESLTPAAKNYYKKVAQKYKKLTLDGVSLETLLTKDNDISLSNTTLNEKQLGFIPDKSALVSTASTLERDYLKKTYKRQVAGVISSFAKNGLYLVDIKQENRLTTFDNYTTYRCQYEDINGNKSTIKFDIPNIDSNDRFVTDGKPQVIKKQRIALPIIKINDHEVSLSSNYNKVRVYRNPSKAHNYGSYIYSLLSKKSIATVVYGHTIINEPISYEYTEVASKFREVNFHKDGRKFSLFFDYPHRLKHFNDKEEKLKKLEAIYGTYFGTDNNNYYFVDSENQVYSAKHSGGENTDNEFDCILDLIEYSLKDSEKLKSTFTEWLDITILNGKLPVIFCLAYKYGLRNTLDYLGIKYTVMDNKTKVITGVGNESFADVISSDNPYGDHWIATPTKEGDSLDLPEEFTDSTDAYVTEDSTGNKYIVPEMKLDRPVKPRLGNIKFYFEKRTNENDINPVTIKVKGMVIEVKLGTQHTVTRRVTNYDGLTFKCMKENSIPTTLVEKVSDYLNCSERKVSMATVISDISSSAIVKELSGIPQLSISEYSKMTSKLNKDSNKVGNEVFGSKVKYKKQAHDVQLKFADRTIVFNRYPISKSLVAAGLDRFDLTLYDLNEFEDKDVYYRMLVDAGISPNLLKGIDAMFDLFIDNITYQVLKSMNEPTNFRDLLIRCGVLLATKDHKDASSAANYRIRGYEQFPAILYNEISRNVATYLKTAKVNKKTLFSVNPQAVYLRIIQNQSTMPAEAANPLEDVKIATNITYAGIGGRDGESFVQSDRIFADDDIGILSEGTADSGKVGMNAMTSFNPLVSNTTGLLDPKTPDQLTPSNCLSLHSLMMPFSSADDK